MDPNANLEEQRRLVARMLARIDSDQLGVDPSADEMQIENAARLVELVEALDGWLSKGGFLPKAWGERQTIYYTGAKNP